MRTVVAFLVIAYVGLALVATLGFRANARVVKKATLEQTAVARCLDSRKPLLNFKAHVEGVDSFSAAILDLNAYRLDQLDPDDPAYAHTKKLLAAAVLARDKIKAFPTFPVPTVQECKEAK